MSERRDFGVRPTHVILNNTAYAVNDLIKEFKSNGDYDEAEVRSVAFTLSQANSNGFGHDKIDWDDALRILSINYKAKSLGKDNIDFEEYDDSLEEENRFIVNERIIFYADSNTPGLVGDPRFIRGIVTFCCKGEVEFIAEEKWHDSEVLRGRAGRGDENDPSIISEIQFKRLFDDREFLNEWLGSLNGANPELKSTICRIANIPDKVPS